MSERIIAAAIHQGGVILSLPPPARHHTVMRHMVDDLGVKAPVIGKQGFVTSAGRFVSREEAAQMAYANGQIRDDKPVLYSEDLW